AAAIARACSRSDHHPDATSTVTSTAASISPDRATTDSPRASSLRPQPVTDLFTDRELRATRASPARHIGYKPPSVHPHPPAHTVAGPPVRSAPTKLRLGR